MKATPRGRDWVPAASVIFTPVPFKLLRVKSVHGMEFVSGDDMGDYAGHPFDPWKRGDLVAVQYTSSYWKKDEGIIKYDRWFIGRRHSTPSAPNLKVDAGGRVVTIGGQSTLWRIPYRFQASAAMLIGQEFESRESLEAAI